MKDNNITSFTFGAIAGLTLAFFVNDLIGIKHHIGATVQPAQVSPVSPALFAGGNTAVTGQIGTTGLTHGPATVLVQIEQAGNVKDINGKKAQDGYYYASKVWTQSLFCGATSAADAQNRVALAIARYIAAKLDKPINYYETPEFIQGVKQVYGKYVTQVASHLYPTCNFKPFTAIPSDHTQNDGVFDPTKQIADDMLHFGCLGAAGLNEYYSNKIPTGTYDCAGESAVADNSPYRTS